MNNLLLILTSVIMGAVGQILLKVGANKLTQFSLSPTTIFSDIWGIVRIPEIIIGLGLFGTSFLLWVKVLTKNDLSYAYPMVSLSYIIITIASFFLFHESISINKVIGILVIVFGVFLINR